MSAPDRSSDLAIQETPPPAGGVSAGAAERPQHGIGDLIRATIAPLGFMVAALVLPYFVLRSDRPFRGPGLGPGAWPRAVLVIIGVCAAAWLIREVVAWTYRRARRTPHAVPVMRAGEEAYHYPKALAGMALVLAYGMALPMIGFPLATVLFFVGWMLLGGIRNPVALGAVSLVGTGVLLWVFMGLALMPLSRGQGMFDEFSIAVLRLLRIY